MGRGIRQSRLVGCADLAGCVVAVALAGAGHHHPSGGLCRRWGRVRSVSKLGDSQVAEAELQSAGRPVQGGLPIVK